MSRNNLVSLFLLLNCYTFLIVSLLLFFILYQNCMMNGTLEMLQNIKWHFRDTRFCMMVYIYIYIYMVFKHQIGKHKRHSWHSFYSEMNSAIILLNVFKTTGQNNRVYIAYKQFFSDIFTCVMVQYSSKGIHWLIHTATELQIT